MQVYTTASHDGRGTWKNFGVVVEYDDAEFIITGLMNDDTFVVLKKVGMLPGAKQVVAGGSALNIGLHCTLDGALAHVLQLLV